MAVGRPGEQRGNSGLERGGVLRDQLTGNPNREEMEKSIREGQRYAGDPIACGKDRIGLRLGLSPSDAASSATPCSRSLHCSGWWKCLQ